MSQFTNALVVSPLADGKTWVILKAFGYDVGKENSGDSIHVEIGFMTDFASIPRLFWFILPRWGKYGNAAVIHDWLYWIQERTREASDHIMLEAMGVLDVQKWKKYAIYGAVRLFGWIAWKRNQRDRINGFDRVIKDTRIDATQIFQRPSLF